MDPGQLPAALAKRYRVERTIAGPAFGQVFEATQLELDRRVALRELIQDLWYFGAQVDAATTTRRAQRALASIEKFEAAQPHCTAAWRGLARVTEVEIKKLGTARFRAVRAAGRR